MATLNELLARWLARRLKAKATGRTLSPAEIDALLAQVEDARKRLRRMKESAEKREQRHEDLKAKHRLLKKEAKQMQQEARKALHEIEDLTSQMQVLKEQQELLRSAVEGRLSLPGGAPLETIQDDHAWRQFLHKRRQVWRYPMRLGVLRQHEPRPLKVEKLPDIEPPGERASWPRVALVTPSYQQAAFLGRTLTSVLEQDYPFIEYRVMDGGSRDGSVALIQEVASRLAGWESGPDSGPASAINRGFAQSAGEIMAWLNSDDLLLPGVVRFVAAYFARHPEVDVVYGNRIVIDERDHQVGRWVLPPHDDEMLLWMDYIPQETLFWRRQLWEKVGGRLDESFQFAFDWDLLLRFQRAGARMRRLPWFLGCFRVHDAQKSSAEIGTVGRAEMARLRQRELGEAYTEERMGRRAVAFQGRAIWHDRCLRAGLRLPAWLETPRRESSVVRVVPEVAAVSKNRWFCTYFDTNYAAAGIALLESLRRHCPAAQVTVLCLDDALLPLLKSELGGDLATWSIADLEAKQPGLKAAMDRRQGWERYALLKPFFIEALLREMPEGDCLAYVDADLYFFGDTEPLFGEMAKASVGISPHRFNSETESLGMYGTFNAGLLLCRHQAQALTVIREWRDQCAAWCQNQPEPDGRFMDQGYLTSWLERHSGVVALTHPGQNVAPWNVGTHRLAFDGQRVRVDGSPLLVFHFSGLIRGADGQWRTFYAWPSMRQPLLREWVYAPYLQALEAITARLRERHGVEGLGTVRELDPGLQWLDLSAANQAGCPEGMVWLASYPRCGNKLARLILSTLYEASTYTVYEQLGEPDKVPVTPVWEGELPPVLPESGSVEAEACFFLKTHELPTTGHPALYVVRDGRDAYVSYAHFVRQHFPDQVEGLSFEEVLRLLVQSRDHFAGWSAHVAAWTGRSAPTAVIRYEEMVRDPDTAMTKACEALGIRLPKARRELPRFESLKAAEPAQFRRGQSGAWRDEMPPDIEALFWERHGAAMERLGYQR